MALRKIDSRDDLTRYLVTSIDDLDLQALSRLMDEAWAADYVDQVRVDFNTEHLHHMMIGEDWFAILVCDADNRPVGFEVAMERTLYCRGESYRAYYATAFTVSSKQRRRGIGQWVLEGINQVAFQDYDSDLLFSAFHNGAAGSPTVQATFDQIADWRVERFHSSPNFGIRVDRDPPATVGIPLSVARVTWPDLQANWCVDVETAAAGQLVVPGVEAFGEYLRTHYDVAFGVDKTFRDQFLLPGSTEGEMLWYGFGGDARACVCVSLMPLKANDRVLKPAGMVQAVHAEQLTEKHFEQMLLHLAHRFRDQGCLAISIYDLGVVPRSVIDKLKLAPDEGFDYAVRGPGHVVKNFAGVSAPFFIDLT